MTEIDTIQSMRADKRNGFIIDGEVIPAPDGIIVNNYLYGGEPHFKCKQRTSRLTNFVLHETAGRSAAGCKRTLVEKGYGVQLILDRDGTLSCHGDLVNDQMVHGNQLNAVSIGIEVVNPYTPSLAKGMEFDTIPARWWTWCPDKSDRRYVLPTQAQLDMIQLIVPWLCYQLDIPYKFPTADLNAKKPHITGWLLRAKPGPGVVAHQDFASHSDGRYLLETLIENADQPA